MNQSDQERWDRKYREKSPAAEITPDTFLARSLEGIAPGSALDMGCGFGDNAITLAGKGFHVTAIDISPVGIDRARIRAREAGAKITFIVTDVEDFDFGDQAYDLITGFYFLNRTVFSRIKRGLKPSGIFLYKTYTVDELRYRPELNKDYLLGREELKGFFDDFNLLLYEERDNGKECHARMIARRP